MATAIKKPLPSLDDKLTLLRQMIRPGVRVAIAFSGGVDSTLLLKVATDMLGPDNVLAVIADSPSLPRREKDAAERLAATIGVTLVTILTDELNDPRYATNPADRCYFCKRVILAAVRAEAERHGIDLLLDGQNIDDLGDWRPGTRAVRECGVRSPLLEAGLTKADIRALSERFGLPTASKPAMACLASRIPYGTPITRETLRRIEVAERNLQDLGFNLVRVRHHGDVARIEIGVDAIPRLLDPDLRKRVIAAVRAAGYAYAALDLEGYRSGNLNRVLQTEDGDSGPAGTPSLR